MKNIFLSTLIIFTFALHAEARQSHVCGSEFDVSFSDYEVEQAMRTHQPTSVVRNLRKIAVLQKQAHRSLKQLADFESQLHENQITESEQTQIAAFNAEVVALCFQIEELR